MNILLLKLKEHLRSVDDVQGRRLLGWCDVPPARFRPARRHSTSVLSVSTFLVIWVIVGEMYRNSAICLVLVVSCLSALVSCHEHHDDTPIPTAEATAPIDSILWFHIFLQGAVWGILFPIGMVLGLSRSKWHVPLQVTLT